MANADVPQPGESKYRFILIQAFRLPADSPYLHRKLTGTKEETLMDYPLVAPLLEGVEWDLHGGAPTTYGNWAVENRQEFCFSAAARLPLVREACEAENTMPSSCLAVVNPALWKRAKSPGHSASPSPPAHSRKCTWRRCSATSSA